MIGISISTHNRPAVLEYSLEQFDKFRRDETMIVIDDHSDCAKENKAICKKYNVAYLYNEIRRGIPRTKERGFRRLLTCDYQFWFDDDFFPIADWQDILIEATDVSHLLYLKEWAHIKIKECIRSAVLPSFDIFTGATACFMSFRKEMYKDIHGFQANRLLYGDWHWHLSMKLSKYGLGEYVSLTNIGDYFHSFDIDGIPPDFVGSFESSLTKEERVKK